MNNQGPFFSVIILAFDRPTMFARALESVSKQLFKDFEVIIVDGGKKHISKTLSLGHKIKPRYYEVNNFGIDQARDFGLNQAVGQWVAFLDDDDEYLPEHLQSRNKIILENSELEFLYNGFQTIGSETVPDLLNPGEFLSVYDPAILHAGTAVIKTAKAKEVGGFKNTNSVNYPDNFLEVAKKAGLKMLKIEEPRTYLYHRNSNSYTGKLQKKYKKDSNLIQNPYK
jgi:glycosyltransferase involved in cell wall biosynthesis